MPIYLMNGRVLMPSKKNVNLDKYFEFLRQLFALFGLPRKNRTKIEGNYFKL